MRKVFLTAIAMLVLTSCDVVSMENAQFDAYNVSNDNIVAIVNGNEFSIIPGNRPSKFVVSVPVPRQAIGTPSGPSQVDKMVKVSVAFRNLVTGKLTSPTTSCWAGAKVVTTIWYEVNSARCTNTYAR